MWMDSLIDSMGKMADKLSDLSASVTTIYESVITVKDNISIHWDEIENAGEEMIAALDRFTASIKDIDDGYNIAYPDEHGYFARVMEICAKDDYSGYRQSGRQIYTLLKHAGYTDVSLEKMGLSTIGMDYDERSALFDTYFSFILEDFKLMLERCPADNDIRDIYKWYENVYEDLEETFLKDDFYFNLGFVMYTAKKI